MTWVLGKVLEDREEWDSAAPCSIVYLQAEVTG